MVQDGSLKAAQSEQKMYYILQLYEYEIRAALRRNMGVIWSCAHPVLLQFEYWISLVHELLLLLEVVAVG